MTKEQFIESIRATFNTGVKLVKLKNADYGSEHNPFRNFESAAVIGLDVKQAILLRTLDKMSRIGNLLNRPAVVLDEKIEDSILDAINYLAILKAKLEDENNQ